MSISNLLIVAGAGASRELSNDAQQKMPLMGDWANDLNKRLDKLGRLGASLQLPRDPTNRDAGPEFEAKLGRFLAWQRALPTVSLLPSLGTGFGHEQVPDAVHEWFQHANNNGRTIINTIHESLSELFAASRISQVSARDAYGQLLEECRLASDSKLVFATTNYDPAIELGLLELNRRPFWGEDGSIRGESETRIHVQGMATLPHHLTPVMHLHGMVGWYRKPDQQVYAIRAQSYNPQWGQPALLLPDLVKSYEEDALIAALWHEFDQALLDASHVLVIGHSLHDEHLVERLGSVGVQTRLAVGVYAGSSEGAADIAKNQAAEFNSILPRATMIGMQFGRPVHIWDKAALESWIGDDPV